MDEIKCPNFKGSTPWREEWLDDDTFVVFFNDREDKMETSDGEVINTINSLYAEVHLDEDNAVVIGENVYETKTADYIDAYYHCIGDEVINEIGMDAETANGIKAYALARMKTYLEE